MHSCPSCQAAVNAASSACPQCGWNFNSAAPTTPGPTFRPAARPKIPCEVELAITVDRTGSSERFRDGIPRTAEIILSQVAAKACSVRCWVASHGDLDEGQDFILHTDGGDVDQAVQDMKSIAFGGGGDPPEHHLDAVEELLNRVPWSADPTRARGAILAFTTADTKPARSGVAAAELGKRIASRGLLLYLVGEPTPVLHSLVSGAGGLLFQISNSPDTASLQRIAAQLSASIVASVARGSTQPLTVPMT